MKDLRDPLTQLIDAVKNYRDNPSGNNVLKLGEAINRAEHVGSPYETIRSLVEWESYMGRFDARAWQEARQLVRRERSSRSKQKA